MKERPSAEELQAHVLDAIAACWITSHDSKEGIMLDSFQSLLLVLKAFVISWAGVDAPIKIVDEWSDETMWDLLHSRFGAVEYPIGVLQFAKEQATVAMQRLDSLRQTFPSMVDVIEKTLPTLA